MPCIDVHVPESFYMMSLFINGFCVRVSLPTIPEDTAYNNIDSWAHVKQQVGDATSQVDSSLAPSIALTGGIEWCLEGTHGGPE